MPAKILIVEDNRDMLDLLAVILKMEGHTVYTAEDGSEGVKLVQADCPDLILSDINMPNMDGVEMVRCLRAMPACNKVPILMMSAYRSGSLAAAIEAGANQAVRKPVDLELIIKAINRLLG